MKRFFLAFALLFTAPLLLAQTPTPAPAPNPAPLFTVSTQAVAIRLGGQTVAGTDLIGSYNLMPNLQLQSDNILAPAINLQSYLGGISYQLGFLSKSLAKTNLSAIKPYVNASVGITRNVPPTGASQQHYAALVGGGFNYAVSGTFSFGPRINFFDSPGFGASPHGVVVSANLSVVLGSKK